MRGGAWDKPSLARAGDRLAIGGYADARFQYTRVAGVTLSLDSYAVAGGDMNARLDPGEAAGSHPASGC